jgi:hypothetical protein
LKEFTMRKTFKFAPTVTMGLMLATALIACSTPVAVPEKQNDPQIDQQLEQLINGQVGGQFNELNTIPTLSAKTVNLGTPITVPAALEVPAGNIQFWETKGRGFQIYTCSDTATGPGWVFKSPLALLLNAAGRLVGTHYAGPTWQSRSDGSTVVGQLVTSVPSPRTLPSIPWLLVRAKSTTGTGLLSNTTFIQRLETIAGRNPSDAAGLACTTARLNQNWGVYYETIYRFFRAQTPLDAIQVPAGNVAFAELPARGTQIYTCQANATNTGFNWVFKAPQAELLNAAGKIVGTHFAGPTWQSNADGSTVVGQVLANVPSSKTDTIPLLLLRARSTTGNGLFSNTTFIQRLETSGGAASALVECNASRLNQENQVLYTAVYKFFRAI